MEFFQLSSVMKLLLTLIATYLVFVLQTSLADVWSIAGCVPNLPLAGVIVMAGLGSGRRRIVTAAAWGLIADCLADGRLGPALIGFSLCFLVIERCHLRWGLGSPVRLIAISVPLVLLESTVTSALRVTLERRPLDLGRLGFLALGSTAWTVAVIAGLTIIVTIASNRSRDRSVPGAPALSNKWRMLTE
jgi:rod shape-determining protein MreD